MLGKGKIAMVADRFLNVFALVVAIVFILLFASEISYAFDVSVRDKIIREALSRKLYEKETWKALLHYHNGVENIKDPRFILSSGNFSLRNELVSTIDFILGNPDGICKFPARWLWIKHELNLPENIDISRCPGLKTYVNKAPADQIYIDFASENVDNPSSMLGHVFFHLRGRKKDLILNHAVSFYTVLNSSNPLKLLWESLFSGMPGYFSLMPYDLQLNKYLLMENRNVWDFNLHLGNFEKQLIYFHIWELKGVKQKYYYINYNCSTVVLFLLALGKPDILKENQLFVSPRKVIRIAYKNGLIDKGYLYPANKWLIIVLQKKISLRDLKKLKKIAVDADLQMFNSLFGNQHNGIDKYKYLELVLLDDYLKYLDLNTANPYRSRLERKIDSLLKKYDYVIDISDFVSPIVNSLDSKFSVGLITNNKDKKLLRFTFSPISYDFIGKNRSEIVDNYVSLLDFAVDYGYPHYFKLDHFYIYRSHSFIPVTYLVREFSKQFSIGLDRYYVICGNDFRDKMFFVASGGFGYSIRPINDLTGYALLNLEALLGIGKSYFVYSPEVGFLIDEIFGMRTIASVKLHRSLLNSGIKYLDFSIKQRLLKFKNNVLEIDFNLERGVYRKDAERRIFSINYSYYF